MEWEILEVKMEKFQALNAEGFGYELKLKRKLFRFITLTKNCRSVLPASYTPKVGDFLNS